MNVMFSKRYALVLFVLACLLCGRSLASEKNSSELRCDAIELIAVAKDYNNLVCSGIESMNAKDYKSAIRDFRQAMSIKIVEVPNFELYPRLALAYSLNGDQKKAAAALDKAELSLKIFTRIYKCVETDKGFHIGKEVWGKTYKVKSPYIDEIANRMCGAAYEYMYERNSLEDILVESKLVNHYLEIKRTVEQQQGKAKAESGLLPVR